MSGFKYKGTDLNQMIGAVSTQTNTQGNLTQYIKDANSTSTLSPFYNPLTNLSGPVPTYSIARLANPTKYLIPGSGDIANSVIAYYNDFTQVNTIVSANRPSWATSCSVIIIGGGGSGASGSQGFNPSPGQKKGAQQGNCGGGGGAGGMVTSYGFPIGPASQITVTVGQGGLANAQGILNLPGNSGNTSSVSISNSSQQLILNALGGGGGYVGSNSSTTPGLGGIGAYYNYQKNSQIQGSVIRGFIGSDGQDGAPSGPSNSSSFAYCNGGFINSQNVDIGNYLPYQIISNGGIGQQQNTLLTQITSPTYTYQNALGQYPVFAAAQGYGAGGAGGAGGTQGGVGPLDPRGGAGSQGFVRIYWINTA